MITMGLWNALNRACDRINEGPLGVNSPAMRESRAAHAGWTQSVTTGSDAGKRITATRLVTVGVFALAAKKRTGHIYLDTYNAAGVLVASDEHPAKDETKLRKQAAEFNRTHSGTKV
jgi:hypothetical protein